MLIHTRFDRDLKVVYFEMIEMDILSLMSISSLQTKKK